MVKIYLLVSARLYRRREVNLQQNNYYSKPKCEFINFNDNVAVLLQA